jgi:hypothetical protein
MHDFVSWGRKEHVPTVATKISNRPGTTCDVSWKLPPYELCTYLAAGARPGVTHK